MDIGVMTLRSQIDSFPKPADISEDIEDLFSNISIQNLGEPDRYLIKLRPPDLDTSTITFDLEILVILSGTVVIDIVCYDQIGINTCLRREEKQSIVHVFREYGFRRPQRLYDFVENFFFENLFSVPVVIVKP